ncbi:hypothetical protein LZG04_25495 [Saccharothrix sp. S26]|uniref:nSTAND1 domain-containing NTPase n=1 Tax=Saccharothrix sp. S26 TaxID=2907215 RepID=UPI001F26A271|nr:hypothetical protein [Saccharothrix sp. S26]MCE6998125.1 hypothetical protein [Saccharothrix sp. S26]
MPRPERPLGPEDSVLISFARSLRNLREKAGSPTYRELARSAHYSAASLSEAAAGRKLPSLDVTLAFVRACGGDVDEWRQRWKEVAAELAADSRTEEPSPGGRTPYAGLAAFQRDDSEWFFGRERLVQDLYERVARGRFHAVCGPSGVGKSSVLRAGLLARVEAEGLPAGPAIAVLVTPGAHPLEECAVQLAARTGKTSGQVHADLESDPRNLHRGLLELLADRSPGTEVLLMVDQFEEVFTLCRDRRERALFISALVTAAEADNSRVRVVLGMRSDFYTRCSDHPELAAALTDSQVLVGAMTPEQLRRAVCEPAVRVGCRVEGALLAEVVAAAAGQPGALPTVSHALLETWKRRKGNTLSLAGYRAAGGIDGALAHTAENVYVGFSAAEQQLARELFLRLTALGEGTEDTRRRIDREELDDSPGLEVVLTRLADARLITLEESTAQLAHEALISGWPRLRQWLSEDRDGLRTHRALTDAARTWTALDEDPGALYRGARLAAAREWAERDGNQERLTSTERAFLRAGDRAENAEQQAKARRLRQLRLLTVGLAVLLVATTTLGVVALRQGELAVRAGRVAVSRQLAAQAMVLRDSRPATAKLLSAEAFRTSPTAEARGALLSTSARESYLAEVTGHTNAVSDVVFSADGDTFLTVSKDQAVIVWDTRSRTRRATLTGHATWLRAVAVSPDGRTVATAGDDREVVLWDAAAGRPVARLTGHTDPVKDLDFSPDGRALASTSLDRTVIIWDVGSRTPIGRLAGHTGAVLAVAFSPDGQTLATGSADRTVGLWRRDTATRTATLTGHTESVDAVAFAPDGRTVASAGPDRTVRLWDTTGQQPPTTLTGHTGQARAVAFSPDGQTLASAGHDQTVILWDVPSRTPRARLTGHHHNIYTLAFHPDQPLLASAGEDRRIVLWDTTRTPLAGHADLVTAVAFSPDGETVATGGADRAVILWDARERVRLATIPTGVGPVNAVAFSPDGRTLAAGGGVARHLNGDADHGLALWDVTDRARPTPTARLVGHTDQLRTVAFSPDGRTLATAGTDRELILWDLGTRAPVAHLEHQGTVNSVAFHPDGRTVVGSTQDESVVWNVADHTRVATLPHGGAGHGAVFSPDGRTLATVSAEGTVIVWDTRTWAPLRTLTHPDPLVGIAFSPDGRTLATGSTDRTVVLWDAATGAPLAALTEHTAPVNAVAFSPDGESLVTGSSDKSAILWHTDPEDTTERVCRDLARDLTEEEWRQFLPETPYRRTCAPA